MLYYINIIGNSKSKYYGVVITGHVLARLLSFGSAHLLDLTMIDEMRPSRQYHRLLVKQCTWLIQITKIKT